MTPQQEQAQRVMQAQRAYRKRKVPIVPHPLSGLGRKRTKEPATRSRKP